MPPPSRDEPPPDPHGFRDVIARRRKAAEDDRDRIRTFERACASSRDDMRRTARALESTARHRHAAQLESLANALKRAREVPPAFSPSLIAVRWLWRQLMDAKRLEEASELGAHASAVEERETTRHLATVDAENAARLASACVGHAKELQSLAASLASCERELAGAHARVGRKLTRPGVGAGEARAGAREAIENGARWIASATSSAEDVAAKSSERFARALSAIETHTRRRWDAYAATYDAAHLPRDETTGEVAWSAMREPPTAVMRANGVDRASEARRTLREVTAAAAAVASSRAEEAARDARRRYRLERLSAGRGPFNATRGGGAADGAAGSTTGPSSASSAAARRRARERAAADARWIEPSDEAEGIVPTRPEHEEAETTTTTNAAVPSNASRRLTGSRSTSRLTGFADDRDGYMRGVGVEAIVATTAAIEANAARDDDDDGDWDGDERDDSGPEGVADRRRRRWFDLVDDRLGRTLWRRRSGMKLTPPRVEPKAKRADGIKPRSSFNLARKRTYV